jgi:hypothetical protein
VDKLIWRKENKICVWIGTCGQIYKQESTKMVQEKIELFHDLPLSTLLRREIHICDSWNKCFFNPMKSMCVHPCFKMSTKNWTCLKTCELVWNLNSETCIVCESLKDRMLKVQNDSGNINTLDSKNTTSRVVYISLSHLEWIAKPINGIHWVLGHKPTTYWNSCTRWTFEIDTIVEIIPLVIIGKRPKKTQWCNSMNR